MMLPDSLESTLRLLVIVNVSKLDSLKALNEMSGIFLISTTIHHLTYTNLIENRTESARIFTIMILANTIAVEFFEKSAYEPKKLHFQNCENRVFPLNLLYHGQLSNYIDPCTLCEALAASIRWFKAQTCISHAIIIFLWWFCSDNLRFIALNACS